MPRPAEPARQTWSARVFAGALDVRHFSAMGRSGSRRRGARRLSLASTASCGGLDPVRMRHGDLSVLFDPLPGPLTAISIAIRAGSRADGRLPGLAHMTEHMLFQGTRRLDQLAINR